jgi:hypothetical protein
MYNKGKIINWENVFYVLYSKFRYLFIGSNKNLFFIFFLYISSKFICLKISDILHICLSWGNIIDQTNTLFVIDTAFLFIEHDPACCLFFKYPMCIFENKKRIFLHLVTVNKMITMNMLAVWYNDKSVCSGLEWISIYFIKDNVYCMWYVSSSVNTQLPNIPNIEKENNEKSERYELSLFWNIKKMNEEKCYTLPFLILLFFFFLLLTLYDVGRENEGKTE